MNDREKPFDPLWSGLYRAGSPLDFKFYFSTLLSVFDEIVDSTATAIRDFFGAFPNPFAMLDVFTRWVTGIPGIIVVGAFDATKETIIAEIHARKLGNKLVRVDDAVRGFFNAQTLSLKQITFTSETSLIGWIVGYFAGFAYRTVKALRLLRGLVMVRTEAEFIDLVTRAVLRRIKLFRFAGIALAMALAVVALGLTVCMFSFALNFGEFKAAILPQDSKRVRIPHNQTQRRQNQRTGSDLV